MQSLPINSCELCTAYFVGYTSSSVLLYRLCNKCFPWIVINNNDYIVSRNVNMNHILSELTMSVLRNLIFLFNTNFTNGLCFFPPSAFEGKNPRNNYNTKIKKSLNIRFMTNRLVQTHSRIHDHRRVSMWKIAPL